MGTLITLLLACTMLAVFVAVLALDEARRAEARARVAIGRVDELETQLSNLASAGSTRRRGL